MSVSPEGGSFAKDVSEHIREWIEEEEERRRSRSAEDGARLGDESLSLLLSLSSPCCYV